MTKMEAVLSNLTEEWKVSLKRSYGLFIELPDNMQDICSEAMTKKNVEDCAEICIEYLGHKHKYTFKQFMDLLGI